MFDAEKTLAFKKRKKPERHRPKQSKKKSGSCEKS
jgi:hypothetical protein